MLDNTMMYVNYLINDSIPQLLYKLLKVLKILFYNMY